jgi:hypothetical protein
MADVTPFVTGAVVARAINDDPQGGTNSSGAGPLTLTTNPEKTNPAEGENLDRAHGKLQDNRKGIDNGHLIPTAD